ncbi:MAG: crotonase/enoyl-CoA hydratase family protein [Sorangiineae bacterium]|nr:crotonase/enoyl-CoA hydratase family protein [Polyangiaceae bacterium]MEB2321320.1 crotonase/enoyl-CoA hydratase family protein [Sorangiineae bacterium]
MPETLSVTSREHVTTVTIEVKTMPPRLFQELGAAFDEIAADPEVRAVIVRSSQQHFTYGLDLGAAMAELGSGVQGGLAGPRLALHQTILRLQSYLSAVAACPVPVIAAIHGWCIGGGIDLACACDLRYAASDARFSVRETRIAIVADLGTLQRLPSVVGEGHARELAFTGRDIDAARAREIGLVNDVAPDHESLLALAESTAAQIVENAPITVRGVKRVLDFGRGRRVADGLDYVAAWNAAFLASEDLGEAVTAFLEKRQPKFTGR